MNPKTLIIGFEPLSGDLSGQKPRAIKLNKYLEDLIKSYDLGEVHYVSRPKYREVIHEINPLAVITFDQFTAEEVRDIKKDAALYVTDYPTTIFSRKAEIEKKQEKQNEVFKEVEYMIKTAREKGEDGVRKFASMSYDDMYKMIQKGIISDDKELSKKCWDLLNNGKHENFIWMRAQLVVDCWQAADAKGKYDFLMLAMGDHVETGFAYEMDRFTDLEGIEYRQYEFMFPDGERMKEIRRIPIPSKGMSKPDYEAILMRYDTDNGARMLLEVGLVKKKFKEYTDLESENIYKVLKSWKEDPARTMKELSVITREGQMLDVPLPECSVLAFKKLLKKWNIVRYRELFSEEEI